MVFLFGFDPSRRHYCIGSKASVFFERSNPFFHQNFKEGFVEGDIIGCHIYLNPGWFFYIYFW